MPAQALRRNLKLIKKSGEMRFNMKLGWGVCMKCQFPAGKYWQLEVDDKRLYFLDRDPYRACSRNNLKTLAIAEEQPAS